MIARTDRKVMPIVPKCIAYQQHHLKTGSSRSEKKFQLRVHAQTEPLMFYFS